MKNSSFIDHVHLTVQAGSGGNGCESYFHRMDKKNVADGGDGGHGGAIIIRADGNAPGLASFRFRQRIIAEAGGHGSSSRKRGRNGNDTVLLVPPGTRIYDRQRGFLIRSLDEDGDAVTVLEGGRGGSGNCGGKVKTPGTVCEPLDIELSLTLRTDVCLVGLPNSGKSLLLNRLTGSQTNEKNYPFATQAPEIGVCRLSDYEAVTICELPSLYTHSHEGRGCGNRFLKHLEGTRFVFYVLEPGSDFCGSLCQGFEILRKEVETYRPAYLNIPFGILVTKRDQAEMPETGDFEALKKKAPCFYVSAETGAGMDVFMEFLRQQFAEIRDA